MFSYTYAYIIKLLKRKPKKMINPRLRVVNTSGGETFKWDEEEDKGRCKLVVMF